MQLPGYCRIPLVDRNGNVRAEVLVDDDDFADLAQYRWNLGSNGYARRSVAAPSGKILAIQLHRQILGLIPGDGLEGDHINGDRFDNRRANLRVVSHALNCQNVPARQNAASPFRGVHIDRRKRLRPWRARVYLNKRSYHLGNYGTQEEAALASHAFRTVHMPQSRPDAELVRRGFI